MTNPTLGDGPIQQAYAEQMNRLARTVTHDLDADPHPDRGAQPGDPGLAHRRQGPPMIARPYTAREAAALVGITLDRFYKNRMRYQLVDGMPAPISAVGKMTWERAGFDAWLHRHDPRYPKQRPANDITAPAAPRNDAEWNEFLRAHYGQPAPQA